jgi:hypothetical protein
MTEVKWEDVTQEARRLAVPGGWIYCVRNLWIGGQESSVFVPNPASVLILREGECGCGDYLRCSNPNCGPKDLNQ